MSNEQLIADLKATRERISPNGVGWCPCGPIDDDGHECILRAAGMVAIFECGAHRPVDAPRYERLYKALNAHLPPPYYHSDDYNDARHTTLQDMYDLIDKTLADLGGLAT